MLRSFVRSLNNNLHVHCGCSSIYGNLYLYCRFTKSTAAGAISVAGVAKTERWSSAELLEIFLNIRYYISTTALQIFAQIISCSTSLWPQIGQLDLSVSLSDSTSNLLISCSLALPDPETRSVGR